MTNVPAELGQLSELEQLDLSNNQLSDLPAEVGQLFNLSALDLSNNQLTSLPSELLLLPELDLDLNGNPLPPEIMEQYSR